MIKYKLLFRLLQSRGQEGKRKNSFTHSICMLIVKLLGCSDVSTRPTDRWARNVKPLR